MKLFQSVEKEIQLNKNTRLNISGKNQKCDKCDKIINSGDYYFNTKIIHEDKISFSFYKTHIKCVPSMKEVIRITKGVRTNPNALKKTTVKKQYDIYLHSDEWQKKREELAKDRNNKCEKCGKKLVKRFHAHHKTYKNFMNEKLEDLMFLCGKCHKEIHGI